MNKYPWNEQGLNHYKKVKRMSPLKRYINKLKKSYVTPAELDFIERLKRIQLRLNPEEFRSYQRKKLLKILGSEKFKKQFYYNVDYGVIKVKKPSIIETTFKKFEAWCVDVAFYLFKRKIWEGKRQLTKLKKFNLDRYKKMDDYIKSKSSNELRKLMVDRSIIGPSVFGEHDRLEERLDYEYDIMFNSVEVIK